MKIALLLHPLVVEENVAGMGAVVEVEAPRAEGFGMNERTREGQDWMDGEDEGEPNENRLTPA
jgi:hypothetical protein